MEWIQQSSLLQPEDYGVLKFSHTSSVVYQGRKKRGDTVTYSSKPLVSDEDWTRWLDEDLLSSSLSSECPDKLSELKTRGNDGDNCHSRLTLLIGGRDVTAFECMAVSHMPVSKSIFPSVVSKFDIHGSIARTINRKLTASFSPMILQHPNDELPSILYNCRSSANWPGDLALSVTYSPGTNSTKGVLYGCSEKIRKQVIDHLSSCDYGLYHPLTLPTLFAEIERRRHFDLVNPMVTELMQRARNIATAHPQPGYAETSQPAGVVQEPKDYMQLWFEISCLRNGLQSWRHEVEKMILHCDDLTRARFYTSKNSAESSESTPVNTALSVDVFSGGDSTDTLIDDIEDLNISGRRIRHRLLEIQDEYDEKIRECGMIIDGMVLAAQLEWNNIGQSDTQTNLEISGSNLEIAKATREDGQQMRSIALLTMIFLPATFVASLFSMSFFEWNPENGQKMLSPYIWMYVVITLVLTGLTLVLWYFFGRPHSCGKAECDDIEGQAGSEKRSPTAT